MSIEAAVQILKAAGDPSRLRLIALLASGEATVGELQQVLGQSQPRVSRHLRLLDEAGFVTKFRDGQWVYYRLVADATMVELIDGLLGIAAQGDSIVDLDHRALIDLQRERERDAHAERGAVPHAANYFSGPRATDVDLLQAIDEAVGDVPLGDVLDVGCGTGRLMCLLGPRARRIVGVDHSKRMRLVARSRIHQFGLANCGVRNGDAASLPIADQSVDIVVLDEVLATATDRIAVLREAARVLRRDAHLLIVDRIRPVARQLSQQGSHLSLIENQLTAQLSELGYKVAARNWFPGRVMEYALFSAVPETQQRRTAEYG